ncbi:MAG: NUDIX domain-containing protein [Ignavibacteriae bacterium]|nr:NUDIX domain-containing protein [Ignavibacteriota bacterium]
MKLATLLYIKNQKGEYLLMERVKDPNKGLMSPPGGKLITDIPETPSECAAREAFEECRIDSKPDDWDLAGIIAEKNFPGIGNIMLFLMEYKLPLDTLPGKCDEGEFYFIHPDNFFDHDIPVTDRLFLWEKILNRNGEMIMMKLDCSNYPEITFG